MKRNLLPLLCVIAFVFVCRGHAQEGARFNIVESHEGLTVLEGIRPVLTYQRAVRDMAGKWPRANYVHPLYDLDGEVITEDFPADHGHHRGIFWAWHQVLVSDQQIGDAWVCDDFQWDVIRAEGSEDNGLATIQATTVWKSTQLVADDGSLVPIVSEQLVITVHPRAVNLRFVDFDIRLTALVKDVRIGGSDDVKGYGGFSPRIKLTGEDVFLSSMGKIEPTLEQLHAGPWIDISNRRNGLAILTHASNPGFPQPWILRRDKSMQNAAYPGQSPVRLSTKSPLQLRYRLIVHRDRLDETAIGALQSQYQAEE